MSELTFL